MMNPDDNWAKVELWRWQHGNGQLPAPDDMRKLDIPAALEAMSKAIERGCKEKTPMPSPMGVCAALEFAARQIRANE